MFIFNNRHNVFISLIFMLTVLLQSFSAASAPKPVIGWLEHVLIDEVALRIEAKIDTGADNSSINARVIDTFMSNDDEWIRFQLSNNHGDEHVLKKKIQRYVNIKRKRSSSLKRPVVLLGVCLGDIYSEVEVNLADRSNFEYQMLIERNYLRGIYVVDSQITHTSETTCKSRSAASIDASE